MSTFAAGAGKPRVVCIGIATLDAIVEVDRLPASGERMPGADSRLVGGGVAATAAVTIARLGTSVAFIGRIGDDVTGRWIRDDLAREGVNTAGLALVSGRRSPLSAVLVERESGARALAPDLGDAGPIELTDDELERCRAADWIHVDHRGLGALPALRAAAIETPISLDDGVGVATPSDLAALTLDAPTADVLRARWPSADSLEAALETALEAADAGGRRRPRFVVATDGANGALAIELAADGKTLRHAVAPPPVAIRSTLGAGDALHGALVAALVDGRPLETALRRAVVCATLACRGLDGRSAIPSAAELDAAVAASPVAPPAPPTGGLDVDA